MKKLLTLALAAAMMAGAAQFALAAEDDGASSIMAQINSFKATNQEKTGGEAAEDKAEAQAPAAAEESEEPAQAQPASIRAAQAQTSSVRPKRCGAFVLCMSHFLLFFTTPSTTGLQGPKPSGCVWRKAP